jgi:hypothetical protein
MAKSNASISKPREGSVLRLHEAIGVVLLGLDARRASTHEISHVINKRGLYRQKDGGEVLAEQEFLRGRNYPKLHQVIDRDHIELRCTCSECAASRLSVR